MSPGLAAAGAVAAAQPVHASAGVKDPGGGPGDAVLGAVAGAGVGEGGGAADRVELAGDRGLRVLVGAGGEASLLVEEPALVAGEHEAPRGGGVGWREGHARKDTWEREAGDADAAVRGGGLALAQRGVQAQQAVGEPVAEAEAQRAVGVDEAALLGVVAVGLGQPGLAARALFAAQAPVKRGPAGDRLAQGLLVGGGQRRGRGLDLDLTPLTGAAPLTGGAAQQQKDEAPARPHGPAR